MKINAAKVQDGGAAQFAPRVRVSLKPKYLLCNGLVFEATIWVVKGTLILLVPLCFSQGIKVVLLV